MKKFKEILSLRQTGSQKEEQITWSFPLCKTSLEFGPGKKCIESIGLTIRLISGEIWLYPCTIKPLSKFEGLRIGETTTVIKEVKKRGKKFKIKYPATFKFEPHWYFDNEKIQDAYFKEINLVIKLIQESSNEKYKIIPLRKKLDLIDDKEEKIKFLTKEELVLFPVLVSVDSEDAVPIEINGIKVSAGENYFKVSLSGDFPEGNNVLYLKECSMPILRRSKEGSFVLSVTTLTDDEKEYFKIFFNSNRDRRSYSLLMRTLIQIMKE